MTRQGAAEFPLRPALSGHGDGSAVRRAGQQNRPHVRVPMSG
ncbi:MAG: hypothetical protein ACOX2K_11615 [Bacillota bacterium]